MQYCYSSMAQGEDWQKDCVLAMNLNGFNDLAGVQRNAKEHWEEHNAHHYQKTPLYLPELPVHWSYNGAIGYIEQLIDRRRMVWWDVNWTDLILPTGQDMHFHQLPPERTEAPSSGREKEKTKKRGEYEGVCWFKNRVALGKHDFYNPSLYKPV